MDRKEYKANHQKEHYQAMKIVFHKDDQTDMKIYDFLKKQKSASGYIKNLVRKEMKQL